MKRVQLLLMVLVSVAVVWVAGCTSSLALPQFHVIQVPVKVERFPGLDIRPPGGVPVPGGKIVLSDPCDGFCPAGSEWVIENEDGDLSIFRKTITSPNPFVTPSKLRVNKTSGNITLGGIVFPDGSRQSTAILKGDPGIQGIQGIQGIRGLQGLQGQAGVNATTSTYCVVKLASDFLPCGNGRYLSDGMVVTSDTGTCSATNYQGQPTQKAYVCVGQ